MSNRWLKDYVRLEDFAERCSRLSAEIEDFTLEVLRRHPNMSRETVINTDPLAADLWSSILPTVRHLRVQLWAASGVQTARELLADDEELHDE